MKEEMGEGGILSKNYKNTCYSHLDCVFAIKVHAAKNFCNLEFGKLAFHFTTATDIPNEL